jgi:threonyl-tRNA synthetase
VLAEAVQELYPGTQVTIGPVIENGFYYDFHRNTAVHGGRPAGDRGEDAEIIARDAAFTKEVWTRDQAKQVFKSTRARTSRSSSSTRSRPTRTIKIYKPGPVVRPLPRPAHGLDRPVGDAFKLTKVAGAYWRGDSQQSDAVPHLRHRLCQPGGLDAYLHMLEEAEKRDHRRLGREMDLFHFQEEGPGVVFWHAKGWTMFQQMVAYMRRRLKRLGL